MYMYVDLHIVYIQRSSFLLLATIYVIAWMGHNVFSQSHMDLSLKVLPFFCYFKITF